MYRKEQKEYWYMSVWVKGQRGREEETGFILWYFLLFTGYINNVDFS